LLKNEIIKEQKLLKNRYKFEAIDKLNTKEYTPEIASALKKFLNSINELSI